MQKLLLLFFMIPSISISFQSNNRYYTFKKYGDEGINKFIIYSLYQDKFNFMWIGTNNGLLKYDGYSFHIYQHSPNSTKSISDNNILSIAEDNDNNLWIGTLNGGLNKFDRKKEEFVCSKYDLEDLNSINSNKIYSILKDNKGRILIGTDKGLNIFDNGRNIFINERNNQNYNMKFTKSEAKRLYEDKNNNIWIGTTNGLLKYNRGIGSPQLFLNQENNPTSISNNNIQSIFENKNGELFIGTERGLNIFDNNKGTFKHYFYNPKDPNSIISEYILSIIEDNNNLIIGTTEGLEFFNGKEFIHFIYSKNDPGCISDNYITCLFKDKSNNIWIGTWRGLNLFSPYNNRFSNYKFKTYDSDIRNSNNIYSFLQDSKNYLWLGTENGIQREYIPLKKLFGSKNYSTIINRLSKDVIRTIYENKYENIWIGSMNCGLVEIDLKNHSLNPYLTKKDMRYKVIDKSILNIYKDNEGFMWIGTSSTGLVKLDKEGKIITRYHKNTEDSSSLSDNKIRTILEDSGNILWIGTNDGLDLLEINKNKISHFKNDQNNEKSISNNIITSLCKDLNNDLWIGTLSGGVNKYSKKEKIFYRYTQDIGLASNIVYGILCDNNGNLWISTNNGISKLNPLTGVMRNYDKSDGLQENDFNTGAYYKSKSGELFFGGINGYNRFYPDDIVYNKNVPNITITKIIKFDGTEKTYDNLYLNDELDLTYKDVYFSIEFASLDFTNPSKNQYAYKLEGLSDEWINIGNKRQLTFSNLSSGEYTFRVKGSNNDGIWNEVGTSLLIRVSSHPLLTNWVKVIYVILIIGFISFYVIKKNNEKKMKIRELENNKAAINNIMKQTIKSMEKEREWIAQNLHDGVNQKILSGMNILDSALMQFSVEENVQNLIKKSKNNFLKAVEEVRLISQKNYPVEFKKFGLDSIVLNLCKDFNEKTKIKINYKIDTNINEELAFNLYRIIQEAFNNIEKHSRAKKVLLNLGIIENSLILEITDDGIGFNLENKRVDGFTKKHFGLEIMQQRSLLFNGAFDIFSEPNKGTKINIKIPV